MERFWTALARRLSERAGLVAGAVAAVTIVFGIGLTQLDFTTSQANYLDSDDDVAQANAEFQDLFGGQAMITVVTMDEGHTVEELFTDETVAGFDSVYDDLHGSGRFQSVVTPLVALRYSDELIQGTEVGGNPIASVAGRNLLSGVSREAEGSQARTKRVEHSLATLGRVNVVPAAQRVVTNPAWSRFLLYDNDGGVRPSAQDFFPDDTHALFVVRLEGNQSIEDEADDAELVVDRMSGFELPNATLTTTGAPILLSDINDYLRGGMLTLGALAVALMAVVLLVLFDVRWRLLPLGVIVVAIVWAFGLAGYLGIPITIVTIAGLPVLLGVGIDYAIQVHSRVEEEAVLDRESQPTEETARRLGPALVVVTFDAVFAFVALLFARTPMLRDFGILLAVGIVVVCLASIVLPLAALGARERRSPTQGSDFSNERLGRITAWLGSAPPRLAVGLAVVGIRVFVAGLAVDDELELQTDPVEWVDQDSDTATALRHVQDEVGSSSDFGVLVEGDEVFTDSFVSFLHELRGDQIAKYGPDGEGLLASGSSVEWVLGGLLSEAGASDLPATGALTREAYDLMPDDLKDILVGRDLTAANVVFRVAPTSLEERKIVIDDIRETTSPPPGVTATPAGLAVIGVALFENLQANRVGLTYLAMLFVLAFLTVRLRSPIRTALSLVPVTFAVGASTLVAYAFEIELSPLTALGGPLVVAACTEFTSLILLRFVEERGRGLEPADAVHLAAARTGRAFIVSALTAVIGVGVLAFSALPLLRNFGFLVAANVTVALASALIVLPPLLVWAERREWVSRGLVKRLPSAPIGGTQLPLRP